MKTHYCDNYRIGSDYTPDQCRLCWRYHHEPDFRARIDDPDLWQCWKEPAGLGDRLEAALARFGITKARVERWLGAPCGCAERQAKLNKLGRWLARASRLRQD